MRKCADRSKTGHRDLIASYDCCNERHRQRLEPREKLFPSASNWELILHNAITSGGVFDGE